MVMQDLLQLWCVGNQKLLMHALRLRLGQVVAFGPVSPVGPLSLSPVRVSWTEACMTSVRGKLEDGPAVAEVPLKRALSERMFSVMRKRLAWLWPVSCRLRGDWDQV